MALEFIGKTKAKIVEVDPQQQKLGQTDMRPACLVRFKVTTSNTVLNQLSPKLRAFLFEKNQKAQLQGQLDGVPVVSDLPGLTDEASRIGAFDWEYEQTGCKLVIYQGVTGDKDIVLKDVKVDKLKIEPHDGGPVDLHFSAYATDLDADTIGAIAVLKQHEVEFELEAPKVAQKTLEPEGDGLTPLDALKTGKPVGDAAKPAANSGKARPRPDCWRMQKPAYYNEHDPIAAAWLRELIARGLIAPGDVDERSIEDVRPNELVGYRQCHFFAGIGVWSYALRRAGWADDREVWTGSAPCQPFSTAGAGAGFADERHLWPAFFHLIAQRRPAAVLGEQVASGDADPWIDLVCADLESLGYAIGALAFPSAGVGAPHIRDRLYWGGILGAVVDAERPRLEGHGRHGADGDQPRWLGAIAPRPVGAAGATGRLANAVGERQDGPGAAGTEAGARRGGAAVAGHPAPLGRLADASGDGLDRSGTARVHGRRPGACGGESSQGDADGALGHDDAGCGEDGRLANAAGGGHGEHERDPRAMGCSGGGDEGQQSELGRAAQAAGDLGEAGGLADTESRGQREQWSALGAGDVRHADSGGDASRDRPGPVNGFWRAADWLACRDGRWRPVEPGTFPLAHGAAGRVGRLRGYGNAVNAEAATAFAEIVKASMP